MSGFGSGNVGDMIRRLADQTQGGVTTPSSPAPTPGMGPGEPNNMNYGNLGGYNSLAQDMSRNVMGSWGFPGGMFGYSPFGNPYAGMNPYTRSPFQPTQPPTMGYGGGFPGGGGMFQPYGFGGGFGAGGYPRAAGRGMQFGGGGGNTSMGMPNFGYGGFSRYMY